MVGDGMMEEVVDFWSCHDGGDDRRLSTIAWTRGGL